jgi:hypothetical protein
MLWAQLLGNVEDIRMFLKDFHKANDDSELRKKLPYVTWVYTQHIVILLQKIFSKAPRDAFRLQRLKELKNRGISKRIDNLESSHKQLIRKVNTNRNRLIAHTDKNFHQILFSKAEVDRMETKFETPYPTLRAKSRDNERYMPADMSADTDEILEILGELDIILDEALMDGAHSLN